MSDVLSQIVSRKLERVADSRRLLPLSMLRANVTGRGKRGHFFKALNRDDVNVIAEVKRRSPSKGLIREDFDPIAIARNYATGGAAAISVLTEEDFFDGSLEHLRSIRAISELPLLRKDFVLDEYQLYEALDAGADAILLIAAILEDGQFNDLLQTAYGLGLDVLVEVHDLEEAERVLKYDVQLLGVNNRSLRTFVTDLATSINLAASLPRSLTLVSESGISTRADIVRLRNAGYKAFLVGEELMRSANELAALRELVG